MTYDPPPISAVEQRGAVVDFATNIAWHNPVALTLTLKQRIKQERLDLYAASANFRHFMNRLNRQVFGCSARRHYAGLKVFPVLEHDELVRFHNHAVIDSPSEMAAEEFQEAVKQSWAKTKWGYDRMMITPMTNDGWVRYIAKLSQKPAYDLSIDWMNARTH